MNLTERRNATFLSPTISIFLLIIISLAPNSTLSIRFPDQISEIPKETSNQPLKTAIFALGSFWRSEAVFGCLDGVVRTTAGYAGGSKANPEYRSLGDHAESVQIEYDPRSISFRQLLEVFWTNHDSRQVFGQGPDVGNQYRSIIFTNGTEESRLAALSKEREQTRSKNSVVTTQIQQLGTFYPAEPEHQKFELKRNPFLLQLIGNLPTEELERSSLAAKLNGYAAELCPPRMQRHIDARINDILRKGWPILRDLFHPLLSKPTTSKDSHPYKQPLKIGLSISCSASNSTYCTPSSISESPLRSSLDGAYSDSSE
ncbi:Peptide methionine sulfoxide reductase A5 [Forsythia ovata]|uniref:Peptide methionine sulfoxide reductase A5 n=1 Tax=Forsythia ovata TaxID=205694 RepID=A0ABD1WVN3_9LAMI